MAGFAGIIAAIGTPDRLEVRQEIRGLVVSAASLVALSLLPLLLSAAPIDVTTVWRCASGIALASLSVYYVTTPRVAFRSIGASRWYPVWLSGDILMLLGYGIVVSGYAGDRYSAVIYLASQFWVLLQVLVIFVRAASPLWITTTETS